METQISLMDKPLRIKAPPNGSGKNISPGGLFSKFYGTYDSECITSSNVGQFPGIVMN